MHQARTTEIRRTTDGLLITYQGDRYELPLTRRQAELLGALLARPGRPHRTTELERVVSFGINQDHPGSAVYGAMVEIRGGLRSLGLAPGLVVRNDRRGAGYYSPNHGGVWECDEPELVR